MRALSVASMLMSLCFALSGCGEAATPRDKGVPPSTPCEQLFRPVQFEGLLFRRLIRLNPQPDGVFVTSGEKRLSADDLRDSRRWMGDILSDAANPFASQVEPSKYYIAKGENQDLLLYEWSVRDYSFKMIECRFAVLLRIKPKSMKNMKGGIDGQKVAEILKDLVNFENASRFLKREGSPWLASRADVSAFQIPSKLDPGAVFTN